MYCQPFDIDVGIHTTYVRQLTEMCDSVMDCSLLPTIYVLYCISVSTYVQVLISSFLLRTYNTNLATPLDINVCV